MSYKLFRGGYQNSYYQIYFRNCCEVFGLESQLFGNPILEIGGSSDFHEIHVATEYPVVNFVENPRASISSEGLSWVNINGDIVGKRLNVRKVGSNIPKRFDYDMSEIIELEKTNPIFHLASSHLEEDRAIDVDYISKSELYELKKKYPLLSLDALEKAIRMSRECSKIDIDKAFDMVFIGMRDSITKRDIELMDSISLPMIIGGIVPIDTDKPFAKFFQRSEAIIDMVPGKVASYREQQLKDHLGNKLLFKCLYRPSVRK